MREQTVAQGGGGERLARPRRHLHQRAGLPLPKRMLDAVDRLDLAFAQALGDEWRQARKPQPNARFRLQPRLQRLRPMKMEERPRTLIRIEPVGEQDFRRARFIIEAQRRPPGRERIGHVGVIAERLICDAR